MASIFDGLVNGDAPKSPTEVANDVGKMVVQRAKIAVGQFASEINSGFDLIWNHPVVTPQAVAAALDTSAMEVFAKHAAAVQFLTSQIPELATYLKQPPAWAEITFEVENDVPTGRVLITEK